MTTIKITEVPDRSGSLLTIALAELGMDASCCAGVDLPEWHLNQGARIAAILISAANVTRGQLPASIVVATLASELRALLREQAEDAKVRLRAAESQVVHFQSENSANERRALRAERRSAHLEEMLSEFDDGAKILAGRRGPVEP